MPRSKKKKSKRDVFVENVLAENINNYEEDLCKACRLSLDDYKESQLTDDVLLNEALKLSLDNFQDPDKDIIDAIEASKASYELEQAKSNCCTHTGGTSSSSTS